ncbi:MAG: hypothetical protein AAGF04_05475 [Chlamydiota bacterium]
MRHTSLVWLFSVRPITNCPKIRTFFMISTEKCAFAKSSSLQEK